MWCWVESTETLLQLWTRRKANDTLSKHITACNKKKNPSQTMIENVSFFSILIAELAHVVVPRAALLLVWNLDITVCQNPHLIFDHLTCSHFVWWWCRNELLSPAFSLRNLWRSAAVFLTDGYNKTLEVWKGNCVRWFSLGETLMLEYCIHIVMYCCCSWWLYLFI